MKIVLHIGTEKTGSTSLQNWAAENREALVDQGVWYSKALGTANHLKIYLWALPPNVADEGFARTGIHTPEARAQFKADLPARLADDVFAARERGCHTYLISNEHCHSRLQTEDRVRAVSDLLSQFSDEIEILLYLRPQIDMAVSLASTAARVGLRVDTQFFERVSPSDYYYNYFDIYKNWKGVFGEDALRLVSFQRNKDTVAHLCDHLGLDASRIAPAKRFNEALDVRTMAIANMFADSGLARDEALRHLTGFPIDLLACEERLQIGLDLAYKVQSRFDETNALVVRARPEILPDDLVPDWARYDRPPNLEQLDARNFCADKLVELVILMNSLNRIATINQKIAQLERSIWAEKLDVADQLLREARVLWTGLPESMETFLPARESIDKRLNALEASRPIAGYRRQSDTA